MTKNRGALDYLFDRTTLIGSIQSQDVEAIEDWLKAHPGNEELNRPFSRDPGDTPLYMAVLLQNMDIVQTLISHGADPTRRDGCGQTVLHRAFEYLREKKVRDIIVALGVCPSNS
jgi:hypothetical protein